MNISSLPKWLPTPYRKPFYRLFELVDKKSKRGPRRWKNGLPYLEMANSAVIRRIDDHRVDRVPALTSKGVPYKKPMVYFRVVWMEDALYEPTWLVCKIGTENPLSSDHLREYVAQFLE